MATWRVPERGGKAKVESSRSSALAEKGNARKREGGTLSFHAPLGRGFGGCESLDLEIGELLTEEEEE